MPGEIGPFIRLPNFSHVGNYWYSTFQSAHVLHLEVNRPVSEHGIKQIAAALKLHVAKQDQKLTVRAKDGGVWSISCTDLHTDKPKFTLVADHIDSVERPRVTDFIRYLGHPDSERPTKTELHRLATELRVKANVYGQSDLDQKGKLQFLIKTGKTHTGIGTIAARLDLYVKKEKPRKVMFVSYSIPKIDKHGKERDRVYHHDRQVDEVELARLVREDGARVTSKRLEPVRDLVISHSRKKPRWTVHIKDVPEKRDSARFLALTVTGKDLTPRDTMQICRLVDELPPYLDHPPASTLGEAMAKGKAALRRLRKPKIGK